MEDSELQGLAFQHLSKRLERAGVVDGVLRLCDQDSVEDVAETTRFTQYRATVVRPSTDFVVFYDDAGRLTGWRDDGRLGETSAIPGNVDAARIKAMNELELPQSTRSGQHRSVELPPIGWVTETILFTKTTPRDDQILKIWSNPLTGRTVQWLAKSGQGAAQDPGPALEDHAAKVVTDVLIRRLGAIVLTILPKWHFLVRAQKTEPIPGGHQVRVNTWRHWSDAWVTIDPKDGLICGDRIDRLLEPASTVQMDQAAALDAMAQFFELPADAVLDQFLSEECAEGHFVNTLVYSRQINGLQVDGDFIEVSLHPTTGHLVRHEYQWRPALDVSPAPRLSKEAARRRVEGQRSALDIDPDLEFSAADLAIVPARKDGVATGAVDRPKAWCLTYDADWGHVVVQVNADTGEVLHIHRSG